MEKKSTPRRTSVSRNLVRELSDNSESISEDDGNATVIKTSLKKNSARKGKII